GTYFVEVVAAASGRPLYSRGFASIYGEWETTAEARTMHRTFSESLRFPLRNSTRLPPRRPWRRTVGAERDGAAGSGGAQMERSRRARHAAAHAVAQGRIRARHERAPDAQADCLKFTRHRSPF